jgi:hypothetical protein
LGLRFSATVCKRHFKITDMKLSNVAGFPRINSRLKEETVPSMFLEKAYKMRKRSSRKRAPVDEG